LLKKRVKWQRPLRQSVHATPDPSTFAYNAAGKRVGKTVGQEGKRFLYDFNRLLQEADADTGETEMLYTSTTDEYGDLISEYGASGSKYHHYDATGSTDALHDPEGADHYAWRARCPNGAGVPQALGEAQGPKGPKPESCGPTGQPFTRRTVGPLGRLQRNRSTALPLGFTQGWKSVWAFGPQIGQQRRGREVGLKLAPCTGYVDCVRRSSEDRSEPYGRVGGAGSVTSVGRLPSIQASD